MKFFLVLIYFLIDELKLNFRRVKILFFFFKEYSFFRYCLYLVNDSFIPSRSKIFRNYILKNSQKWKNKNNFKNSSNKKILITNIFYHAGYTTSEIVVGKNLMEIFNAGGIALLSNYNLKEIILFKSFGIKKIIFLKKLNIFLRLKYFIKSTCYVRQTTRVTFNFFFKT